VLVWCPRHAQTPAWSTVTSCTRATPSSSATRTHPMRGCSATRCATNSCAPAFPQRRPRRLTGLSGPTRKTGRSVRTRPRKTGCHLSAVISTIGTGRLRPLNSMSPIGRRLDAIVDRCAHLVRHQDLATRGIAHTRADRFTTVPIAVYSVRPSKRSRRTSHSRWRCRCRVPSRVPPLPLCRQLGGPSRIATARCTAFHAGSSSLTGSLKNTSMPSP